MKEFSEKKLNKIVKDNTILDITLGQLMNNIIRVLQQSQRKFNLKPIFKKGTVKQLSMDQLKLFFTGQIKNQEKEMQSGDKETNEENVAE